MLVPVPFVRGWLVGVRASRSADSTSVGLSYLWAIAQTRERNCYSSETSTSLSMSRFRILSLLKLSHFTARNRVRTANSSTFLTESLYLRSSLREISAGKTLETAMYERQIDSLIRNTRRIGPSMVEVQTVKMWKDFPKQITEAEAHEIWLRANNIASRVSRLRRF